MGILSTGIIGSIIDTIQGNTLPKAVISPDSEESTTNVSAKDSTIQVVYGRSTVRGKIGPVTQNDDTGNFIGCFFLGWGEINSVEKVYVNDEELDTQYWTGYTGTTSQGLDPTLAANFSEYTGSSDDKHKHILTIGGETRGLAYVVVDIPPGLVSGFPRVTAIVQGMKVHVPGTSTYGTRSTYVYTGGSTVPAYALGDFLDSTLYGAGVDVNWTSVTSVAGDNNTDLGSGHLQRIIGLTLDTSQATKSWVTKLRTYAGCMVFNDGDTKKLVSDKITSTTSTYDNDDIKSGTIKLNKKGSSAHPTVVRVQYQDITAWPWKTLSAVVKASGVDAGTTPWRESVVSLPGIHRYAQAYREAVERLNASTLTDLGCSATIFDEALVDQEGDVVEITHDIGLSSKKFRVLKNTAKTAGRWVLDLYEYDPAVYDATVQTEPTYPDTDLPNVLPDYLGSIQSLVDSSATIVDVFLYDTTQDYLGGAWREKCSHLSWYNETLDTATRGSTRKFPTIALIIAEDEVITIYDGTQPTLPMWIVYDITADGSAVTMRDGLLYIARDNAGVDFIINFPKDTVSFVSDLTAYNGVTSATPADSDITTATLILPNANLVVNRNTIDVAITALPGAPLDADTGLPIPTIAVATEGGLSVITDSGDIYDSAAVTIQNGLAFSPDGLYLYCAYQYGYVNVYELADITADAFTETWKHYRSTAPTESTGLPINHAASSRNIFSAVSPDMVSYIGGSTGLTVIKENTTTPNNGLSNFIATDYQSGFMLGKAIEGAWLANADVTDRSLNLTDLTKTGSITETAVATGAELMGYSGFDGATNNLQMAYNSRFDFSTGDFCVMGWAKQPTDGYKTLFERGAATGERIIVQAITSGYIEAALGKTGTWFLTTGDVDYCINDWFFVTAFRASGVFYLYVNGQYVDEIACTIDLDNAAATLTLGDSSSLSQTNSDGTQALWRVSSIAPSADQIEFIYNNEKHLFKPNANCLLGGTTDVVKDVSYDKFTNYSYTATTDGVSVFAGLLRTDYLDSTGILTSDNINSISGIRGSLLIGSAAEAVAYMTSYDLKELTSSDVGLGDVEDGAEVNVTFHNMSINVPDTPTGSGLFMDATHMGYYDSPNWMTYMASNGDFYLGGTGGNLTWIAATGKLRIGSSSSGKRVEIDADDEMKFYGPVDGLFGSAELLATIGITSDGDKYVVDVGSSNVTIIPGRYTCSSSKGALYARNYGNGATSGGAGLLGSSTSTYAGVGVQGTYNGTSSSGIGVKGNASDEGYGGYFTSLDGVGLYAFSTNGLGLHVDSGNAQIDDNLIVDGTSTLTGNVFTDSVVYQTTEADTATGPFHIFRNSRGVAGTSELNDYLGGTYFQGYESGWVTGALIRGQTTELWDASGRGTALRFYTIENNDTTLTLRWSISHDGNLLPNNPYDMGSTSNPLGNMVTTTVTLSETTTPSADTNFGKIYTKSDNKLYFQDGAGTEHEIAFV